MIFAEFGKNRTFAVSRRLLLLLLWAIGGGKNMAPFTANATPSQQGEE